MYETILVAFSFSDPGRAALAAGAELARREGARLHVFHALDYRLMHDDPAHPACVAACLETEDRFRNEEGEGLKDVQAFFECRPDDPAMAVCKLARDLPASLIVIGVHRSKLARISYTGITIIENAPCPVLVVPLPHARRTAA
ncbi:UspA domain-containing protein [Desulfovibrio sp. X2]|uniref:universal stress protein n=1 Tax=Desulfovibrio sp. X2 TaxID=941449 RepID=UPI0003589316|nr:universal stress protein [Desulfovibrio sp. X2]EPR44385.1 UspA domain-containing protein [Desulfovibrio sp. X2]